MFEAFFPDLMLETVWDIDFDYLIKRNIKGLILDIDNTLVPVDFKVPDEQTIKWIRRAQDAKMKLCFVSNGSKARVEKFNQDLRIPSIYKALKPSKKAFNNATILLGVLPEETAVIGDQIFTDVYGGNKNNMYTILVKPIAKKDLFFVKFKRIFEKPILRSYRKSLNK